MKRLWGELEPHHALRKKDAADYLGVTVSLLDSLVLAQELTPAKIGNGLAFKVEQLHRFYMDHIQSGPPDLFFWNRNDPQLPIEIVTQLLNLSEKDIVRLVEKRILLDLTPQSIRTYLFENQWQQRLLLSDQPD